MFFLKNLDFFPSLMKMMNKLMKMVKVWWRCWRVI